MKPRFSTKIEKEKQRRKQTLQNYLRKEKQLEEVEAKVVRDFRKLFESNGARPLLNLPTVSPVPTERTIFLSKAIRLQPKLDKIKG